MIRLWRRRRRRRRRWEGRNLEDLVKKKRWVGMNLEDLAMKKMKKMGGYKF
jgi:hypothetical protein